MLKRRLLLSLFITAWVPLLASCSGGGGSGPSLPPCKSPISPITTAYANPATLTNATTGTAWQITNVSTTLFGSACESTPQYDFVTVYVSFAQSISSALPGPGKPLNNGNQLGVAIGINTDKTFTTGAYGGCNTRNLKPNEYASDPGFAGRAGDGSYVLNGPSGATGFYAEAQIGSNANVFVETFALTDLGITDFAAPSFSIDVAAVNGSSTQWVSCAPANAQFSVTSPQTLSY